MEMPDVPQDDLLDVMEMTQKLEAYMLHVLRDNDMILSVSALMSATINCLLGQCKTLEEVMFYRNVMIQLFDTSIKSIKIKGK